MYQIKMSKNSVYVTLVIQRNKMEFKIDYASSKNDFFISFIMNEKLIMFNKEKAMLNRLYREDSIYKRRVLTKKDIIIIEERQSAEKKFIDMKKIMLVNKMKDNP